MAERPGQARLNADDYRFGEAQVLRAIVMPKAHSLIGFGRAGLFRPFTPTPADVTLFGDVKSAASKASADPRAGGRISDDPSPKGGFATPALSSPLDRTPSPASGRRPSALPMRRGMRIMPVRQNGGDKFRAIPHFRRRVYLPRAAAGGGPSAERSEEPRVEGASFRRARSAADGIRRRRAHRARRSPPPPSALRRTVPLPRERGR